VSEIAVKKKSPALARLLNFLKRGKQYGRFFEDD
jgi:hypothetical protein